MLISFISQLYCITINWRFFRLFLISVTVTVNTRVRQTVFYWSVGTLQLLFQCCDLWLESRVLLLYTWQLLSLFHQWPMGVSLLRQLTTHTHTHNTHTYITSCLILDHTQLHVFLTFSSIFTSFPSTVTAWKCTDSEVEGRSNKTWSEVVEKIVTSIKYKISPIRVWRSTPT